jgi:hypothetical protein
VSLELAWCRRTSKKTQQAHNASTLAMSGGSLLPLGINIEQTAEILTRGSEATVFDFSFILEQAIMPRLALRFPEDVLRRLVTVDPDVVISVPGTPYLIFRS